MKDFIHTGYYASTRTTVNDPLLKVIEIDNGNSWIMSFYVKSTLIDSINMEYIRGTEINKQVKKLPVYDGENNYLGTVEERLQNVLESYIFEYELSAFESQSPE